MIQIGQYQQLTIIEEAQQGMYLSEKGKKEGKVLLPATEVQPTMNEGDTLEVFIYKDAKGRLIATCKQPKLTLGAVAPLKVVSVNGIGAFLDWGLEKDLFMPFKEQTTRVHQGQTCLVGMYEDKSGRLCATMNVYDLLSSDSPYQVNDEVNGTIYSIKEAYGAFVAVENKYHGLIPLKEMYGQCKEGSTVSVRVRKIREDGKLELSLRKPAYLQMEDDARKIMEVLDQHEGRLCLNDKSSPEEIKRTLAMSKAAFKRAVGRLLKEGVIEITSEGLVRNW